MIRAEIRISGLDSDLETLEQLTDKIESMPEVIDAIGQAIVAQIQSNFDAGLDANGGAGPKTQTGELRNAYGYNSRDGILTISNTAEHADYQTTFEVLPNESTVIDIADPMIEEHFKE